MDKGELINFDVTGQDPIKTTHEAFSHSSISGMCRRILMKLITITQYQIQIMLMTYTRPPTRSSLKITNRSFRYAAPCLWNEFPTDLREPRQIQSPSLSPITYGSLSSSPSSLSPLASSLTR